MESLLEKFIFLPKCKGCQKLNKNHLCIQCKEKLDKCHLSNCNLKTDKTIKYVDKVYASYQYKNKAKEILIYAKFVNAIPFIASFKDDVGIDILRIKEENNIDIVIPVPCHKSRYYEKEYYLPEKMVIEIGEMGINIDLKCIVKVKKTLKQHNLTAEERKINLIGAYEVRKDVKGKNVLIIDDVITTGSTVSEIAAQLKQVGRKKVYSWSYTANEI